LSLATKANLARYAIKSWDSEVDLNLGADGRAFRGEDEHATQPHVPGVPDIIVFSAVGPAKQDGHQESKPVKCPAIDRTIHFDFQLVATRANITSKPVRYKRVIVRGGWKDDLFGLEGISSYPLQIGSFSERDEHLPAK
jgi:hypothetical protein